MKIEQWKILSKLPDEEVELLSKLLAAGGRANKLQYEMELNRHEYAQLPVAEKNKKIRDNYELIEKYRSDLQRKLQELEGA